MYLFNYKLLLQDKESAEFWSVLVVGGKVAQGVRAKCPQLYSGTAVQTVHWLYTCTVLVGTVAGHSLSWWLRPPVPYHHNTSPLSSLLLPPPPTKYQVQRAWLLLPQPALTHALIFQCNRILSTLKFVRNKEVIIRSELARIRPRSTINSFLAGEHVDNLIPVLLKSYPTNTSDQS